MEVPADVVAYIIECFAGDVENLRSCAMVHRAWTPSAQKLLFRDLVIGHQEGIMASGPLQWTRLCSLLKNHPHLRTYPRSIRLTAAESDSDSRAEWMDSEDDSYVDNGSELATLFPKVEELTVDEDYGSCDTEIVLNLPALASLSLQLGFGRDNNGNRSRPPLYRVVKSNVRIKELALWHINKQDLPWLVETGIVKNLELLALGLDDVSAGTPTTRFLAELGQSLTSLTLHARGADPPTIENGFKLPHLPRLDWLCIHVDAVPSSVAWAFSVFPADHTSLPVFTSLILMFSGTTMGYRKSRRMRFCMGDELGPGVRRLPARLAAQLKHACIAFRDITRISSTQHEHLIGLLGLAGLDPAVLSLELNGAKIVD